MYLVFNLLKIVDLYVIVEISLLARLYTVDEVLFAQCMCMLCSQCILKNPCYCIYIKASHLLNLLIVILYP